MLDLPDYNEASLCWRETRIVYLHGELVLDERERELRDAGMGLEEIARHLCKLRSDLRSWTRTLMSDRREAARLDIEDPNPTFDELLAKWESKDVMGDDRYKKIIEGAKWVAVSRTRRATSLISSAGRPRAASSASARRALFSSSSGRPAETGCAQRPTPARPPLTRQSCWRRRDLIREPVKPFGLGGRLHLGCSLGLAGLWHVRSSFSHRPSSSRGIARIVHSVNLRVSGLLDHVVVR